ncbi:ribonuclease H-like domain-containing protein [Cadophora sp. MPI-SDFR-AT-0126]|nr:ribonuclease H-like domain-containing protein [Leotiomycetes sp. MPI-SDFR-AT-0126]
MVGRLRQRSSDGLYQVPDSGKSKPYFIRQSCFNVKIQGTNHVIQDIGVRPKTMVVGADVTHPGKDAEDHCPSLTGIVATHDTHYAPTEHIEDLSGMIYERLLTFYEKRSIWPEHILFYRDGVSDSQYGMVKDNELPQIKEAIENIRGLRNGRACGESGGSENIPPGHVFEDTVVLPKTFNFYLQSHDSPLGTARTGHYVVIANETDYSAKDLQQVTNNLCSMESRAMHCLSVVTPARYADLLCDRLRCYMKPVLEKDRRQNSSDDAIGIRTHAQNRNVWGEGRNPTNRNPWHDNVKDIMFYL